MTSDMVTKNSSFQLISKQLIEMTELELISLVRMSILFTSLCLYQKNI